MSCVRDILPFVNFQTQEIPYEKISSLEVGMKHFMNALLETEPSATREVFVEIPETTWNDVAGLDEIKTELINAVEWPLKHSEIFERYDIQPSRGILLHGASGTGKTLLVKALAHESGVNFINVQSANVLSRYLGESERALKDIFRVAKQAAPSIICFDEIENLFPERSGTSSQFSSTESRLTGQFMNEMHGLEELNGVTVIATTNRIDLLDKSLLDSRAFDLKFEMPLPDEKTREKIFEILLRKKPLDDGVKISELAKITENFTGGDIDLICRRASIEALKRDKENFILKNSDFENAFRIIKNGK